MDRFKKGNKCVFCRSYGVDLHSPKDQDSFNIIIQSALTRNDDVIKSLQNSELRDIFYHADCRKTYVHKKTLRNYDSDNPKKAKLCSYEDDDMPSERMSREKCGYKCVFCLTYGVDLHSPKTRIRLTSLLNLLLPEMMMLLSPCRTLSLEISFIMLIVERLMCIRKPCKTIKNTWDFARRLRRVF